MDNHPGAAYIPVRLIADMFAATLRSHEGSRRKSRNIFCLQPGRHSSEAMWLTQQYILHFAHWHSTESVAPLWLWQPHYRQADLGLRKSRDRCRTKSDDTSIKCHSPAKGTAITGGRGWTAGVGE